MEQIIEQCSKPPKNNIQELPFDIWNGILVRVPAKSVIKLKSVCKGWQELINSNRFRISHIDRWRKIMVCENDTRCSSQELLTRSLQSGLPPFQESLDPQATILHIYDGLLLVMRWDCYRKPRVFLRNRLTKSQIALQPLPGAINNHWTFVYDHSNPGYVIFCATPGNVVFSSRIELNGGRVSGIGFWRKLWSSEKLTLIFPETRVSSFIASISINGKVHWLFDFTDNNNSAIKRTGILTIDVATEELLVKKCIATPLHVNFCNSNSSFWCLNESLSGDALQLWGIDDLDNPRWVKHHVIIKTKRILRSCISLHMWMVMKIGNSLIMYNKDSRTVKEIYIYTISLKRWRIVDDVVYNSEDLRLITMGFPSLIYGSLLSFN